MKKKKEKKKGKVSLINKNLPYLILLTTFFARGLNMNKNKKRFLLIGTQYCFYYGVRLSASYIFLQRLVDLSYPGLVR